MREFRDLLREKMALLKLDDSFAARYVNEGFSGGEKKRLEMLQMAVLQPEMAILDETDSGLDIDALRIVAEGVNAQLNPDLGVLLITHYQRLLDYIKPDVVHVLATGPDRQVRRPGAGAPARGGGLRARSCARPASSRRPDEALPCRSSRTARRADAEPSDDASDRDGAEQPRRARGSVAAAARPPRHPARLPDLRARSHGGRRWPISTAPRRRSKPRAVHRRGRRATTRRYTANVHRGIYDHRRGGHRRLRGRARRGRAVHRRARARTRSCSSATRPRPSTSSPTRGAAGTSRQATPSCSPSWSTTPTSCPWQLLAQEKDADLEFVPIDDEGRLARTCFEVLLRTRAEAGRLHPRVERARHHQPGRARWSTMAHAAGALVLVDGAQAVPHVPVDVQALGADFYVVLGPQDARADGLGRAVGAARAARGDAAVHGRRRDDPRGPPAPDRPSTTCPGSSRRARPTSRPRSASAPRSTTCGELGMDHVRAHERELTAYALDAAAARGARASASTARATPTSAPASSPFNLPGVHPHDVAHAARPRGDRDPGRPPLHDAAPRAARRGRHGAARASTSTRTARTSTAWPTACARSSASSARGCQRRPDSADRYTVEPHGRPVPRRDPRALPAAPQLRHARGRRTRPTRAPTRCAATGSR